MIVRLKQSLLIVTAEGEEERESLLSWGGELDGHVFRLTLQDSQTFRLTAIGPEAEVRREPINVTSRSSDPVIQLISNFAETPFELDGQRYGSVEAFWQGLKHPDEARRREIAPLFGKDAMLAGADAPVSGTFLYGDQTIRVGTSDHWHLMTIACRAKFSQHEGARRALLGTGERPLMHRTRKDSRTIPGVIVADIWMKIRYRLLHPEPQES
jgi:predicted NAD-dependent protein-ADP-ribosyltransferase YbiA (DUF1768 family)